jgi:hypothetical protein
VGAHALHGFAAKLGEFFQRLIAVPIQPRITSTRNPRYYTRRTSRSRNHDRHRARSDCTNGCRCHGANSNTCGGFANEHNDCDEGERHGSGS